MNQPLPQFSIRIAGNAGQGIMSSAVILSKALVKTGLYVLTSSEYPSLIRGGHNYATITFSSQKVLAPKNKLDLLLAFDQEAIEKHYKNLGKEGTALVDITNKGDQKKQKIYTISFQKITQEQGGLPIMENMAYLGTAFKILNLPFQFLNSMIANIFQEKKHKDPRIIELNQKIAKAGYDYDLSKVKNQYSQFPQSNKSAQSFTLLNGNTAIAQGLIAGKLNFYSAYPMTPASEILHYLAQEGLKKKIIVIQPEDEIASINMAIGASFAGARSATGTSGGGFSLMVEALGLAGCTETPVVIINCQRPGPSTGLPTRTEQGDLQSALYASQGEFPRIVLAPGDAEECYEYAQHALNLAEIYQTSVIMLSDKYLADNLETVGQLKNIPPIMRQNINQKNYHRYAFTQNHISPRAIPGDNVPVFTITSNEHNENGDIMEDKILRIKMMQKRMKKMQTLLKQENKIKFYKLHGNKLAKILLIGWGSTKGVILEAMRELKARNIQTQFLQFLIIEPNYWEKIQKILKKYSRLILIENNFSGQLGNLICEKIGIEIQEKILRYDGRPIEVSEILKNIKK